jgi:hypothetical protein
VLVVAVVVIMVKDCVYMWDHAEAEVGTLCIICNLHKSTTNKLN